MTVLRTTYAAAALLALAIPYYIGLYPFLRFQI